MMRAKENTALCRWVLYRSGTNTCGCLLLIRRALDIVRGFACQCWCGRSMAYYSQSQILAHNHSLSNLNRKGNQERGPAL
jgi:hypothetical protein